MPASRVIIVLGEFPVHIGNFDTCHPVAPDNSPAEPARTLGAFPDMPEAPDTVAEGLGIVAEALGSMPAVEPAGSHTLAVRVETVAASAGPAVEHTRKVAAPGEGNT